VPWQRRGVGSGEDLADGTQVKCHRRGAGGSLEPQSEIPPAVGPSSRDERLGALLGVGGESNNIFGRDAVDDDSSQDVEDVLARIGNPALPQVSWQGRSEGSGEDLGVGRPAMPHGRGAGGSLEGLAGIPTHVGPSSRDARLGALLGVGLESGGGSEADCIADDDSCDSVEEAVARMGSAGPSQAPRLKSGGGGLGLVPIGGTTSGEGVASERLEGSGLTSSRPRPPSRNRRLGALLGHSEADDEDYDDGGVEELLTTNLRLGARQLVNRR